MFLKYKNAILSVLYRFLPAAKDIVRHFLVVIFVPSRETPTEIRLYMREIWGKHNNILLVRTVIIQNSTLRFFDKLSVYVSIHR